jgi:translation initiation factor 2 beta subunit (eIF-2beta)/eIF-5
MKTTTIPKYMDYDIYYRYKRHIIQINKLSKNRIEISNLDLILTEINVDKKIFLKYLKKILATSISKDCKISGNFTIDELEECLENYILKYVICDICENPERDEYGFCKACGSKNQKI